MADESDCSVGALSGKWLIDQLRAPSPGAYTPRFGVERADEGWWVRDGDRPIALIPPHLLLDAFEFSPFESLGRSTVVSPRYDMGTYINMHATLLQAIPRNFAMPDVDLHTQWVDTGPERLRLEVRGQYSSGQHTTNVLTIDYDEQIGQYRYRLDNRLVQPTPARQEFCNFYPKHLGDGLPSGKKWQYTVWAGADGGLWKMPQNPALTFAHRLGTSSAIKRVAPGGFIGFGVERDFNPVAVFEHANVPLVSATCDMWYDEHLTFDEPAMEHFDGENYTSQVRFRIVHVPPDVMQSLVDRAQCVPVSEKEILEDGCPGFIAGRVNDLERPLDPRVPQAGQIWPVGKSAARFLQEEHTARLMPGRRSNPGIVVWVDDCAHSGTRSIRLRGLPDRTVYLAPCGHAFHVASDAAYRFDGWIKTGDARAWLWMGRVWQESITSYGHTTSQVIEPNTDWTHVSVELTNTDYPYLHCKLALSGAGHAWFDDLRFDRV